MSKFVTLHGFSGNGVDLNFEVIAYESEEVLLASTPAENTIGVVTTTPMTSWSFSATEPANPENGMIWIFTGSSSSIEFNALKENALHVYPISAKQFVGDDWLERTAMIYQNERWLAWFGGYLYNAGDECVGVTGGWVQTSYPNYSDGNVVKESNYIRLSVSSAPRSACVKTANPIIFSNYNTLSINFSKVELMSGATAKVVVASAIDSGIVASLQLSNGGAGTRTVDLSNVSGAYYVFIYALRPSSSADFDVRFTKVKCE